MTIQQATTNPLLITAILTAIGITLFTLWEEYFEKYVDHVTADDPEFDRSRELGQIRFAGLLGLIAQGTIYLASSESRTRHPWFTVGLFLLAVFIQSQLQFKAERKLRKLEAGQAGHAGLLGRSVLVAAGGVVGYFAFIYICAIGAFVAARALGVPQWAMLLCSAIGFVIGILGGLAISFALAPRLLRATISCAPLEDLKWRELFDRSFARAGIRTPDYWIINTGGFKFSNALVAGFQGFGAGLFITQSLLHSCAPDEIEAVIMHEVSHLKLKHMRQRMVASFVNILATLFGATTLITMTMLFLPAMNGLMMLLVPLAAFFIPFAAVRGLVKKQEIEADAHAILNLGAKTEALASAMRKIDAMNDLSIDRHKDTKTYPWTESGHSSTEERIIMLRQELEQRNYSPISYEFPFKSALGTTISLAAIILVGAFVTIKGTQMAGTTAAGRAPAAAPDTKVHGGVVAGEDSCPYKSIKKGKIDVMQLKMKGGKCAVMVKPSSTRQDKHRSYSVFSNGAFVVFNSTGSGSVSSSTGARAYFFFPRKERPSFEEMTTGEIAVRTVAGQIIRFSPVSGKISSMTGAAYSEDPSISLRNRGGVEIKSCDCLWLDTGWQKGEVAYSNPSGSSTFRDRSGSACAVKNREIFDHAGGEAVLKYETSDRLQAFLSKRCPKLDISMLAVAAVRTAPVMPANEGAGTAGRAR